MMYIYIKPFERAVLSASPVGTKIFILASCIFIPLFLLTNIRNLGNRALFRLGPGSVLGTAGLNAVFCIICSVLLCVLE